MKLLAEGIGIAATKRIDSEPPFIDRGDAAYSGADFGSPRDAMGILAAFFNGIAGCYSFAKLCFGVNIVRGIAQRALNNAHENGSKPSGNPDTERKLLNDQRNHAILN